MSERVLYRFGPELVFLSNFSSPGWEARILTYNRESYETTVTLNSVDSRSQQATIRWFKSENDFLLLTGYNPNEPCTHPHHSMNQNTTSIHIPISTILLSHFVQKWNWKDEQRAYMNNIVSFYQNSTTSVRLGIHLYTAERYYSLSMDTNKEDTPE